MCVCVCVCVYPMPPHKSAGAVEYTNCISAEG